MNKEEIKQTIQLLTMNPTIFSCIGWFIIEDPRGTCCAPPPVQNPNTIKLIEEIFEDKALEIKARECLRSYHERHYLHKKYVVKAFANLLESIDNSYQFLEHIIVDTLKYKMGECAKALHLLSTRGVM